MGAIFVRLVGRWGVAGRLGKPGEVAQPVLGFTTVSRMLRCRKRQNPYRMDVRAIYLMRSGSFLKRLSAKTYLTQSVASNRFHISC